MYIDQLKSGDGISWAVDSHEFEACGSLLGSTSVFLAELAAILRLVERVSKCDRLDRQFGVYSDIKSTFKALRALIFPHTLVRVIH